MTHHHPDNVLTSLPGKGSTN